jgi:hypothetical protein
MPFGSYIIMVVVVGSSKRASSTKEQKNENRLQELSLARVGDLLRSSLLQRLFICIRMAYRPTTSSPEYRYCPFPTNAQQPLAVTLPVANGHIASCLATKPHIKGNSSVSTSLHHQTKNNNINKHTQSPPKKE